MISEVKANRDLVLELGRNFPEEFGAIPIERTGEHVSFYLPEEQEENEEKKDLIRSFFGKHVLFKEVPTEMFHRLKAELYNDQLVHFPETGMGADQIVSEAYRLGASDLHLEPYAKEHFRIRMRIDGILSDRYLLDLTQGYSLVNAIKVRAGLDIAQKRLPQDGRIILLVETGNRLDLRISVIPTIDSERVVIRLLGQNAGGLDLKKLGMDKSLFSEFDRALYRSKGIILVSGPTGSGKTTTLYAAINKLNARQLNIMTAEDPVEYFLAGVSQTAVRPSIGLDFPEVLRSFLRQDPDVIMIGEIRDEKTASIAIRAALTGHLVLSTIHTNDSLGTVRRLMDMGIPHYLISDTLELSIAQRLLRRLCPHCKVQSNRPFEEENSGAVQIFESRGCEKCHYTGYKGRIAIYEWTGKKDLAEFISSGNRAESSPGLVSSTLHLLEDGIIDLVEYNRIKWG